MRWALLFTLAVRSCDTQANKVPPGTFIAKSLIDGSEWVRRPHLSEKDSKCVTVLSSEGRKSVIMCFVFTVFFTLISSRCFTRALFFQGVGPDANVVSEPANPNNGAVKLFWWFTISGLNILCTHGAFKESISQWRDSSAGERLGWRDWIQRRVCDGRMRFAMWQ